MQFRLGMRQSAHSRRTVTWRTHSNNDGAPDQTSATHYHYGNADGPQGPTRLASKESGKRGKVSPARMQPVCAHAPGVVSERQWLQSLSVESLYTASWVYRR